MRRIPAWAWATFVAGLALIVSGAWLKGYAQDVALQVGTVALFVVPLLVAERAITRRLEEESRDQAAVRSVETALVVDDLRRDVGMALGRKTHPAPRADIERKLLEDGWRFERTSHGYGVWARDEARLALPMQDVIPPAVVRTIVRRLGWAHEDWSDEHTGTPR